MTVGRRFSSAGHSIVSATRKGEHSVPKETKSTVATTASGRELVQPEWKSAQTYPAAVAGGFTPSQTVSARPGASVGFTHQLCVSSPYLTSASSRRPSW